MPALHIDANTGKRKAADRPNRAILKFGNMHKRPLLEICVESVAHAIAAETGGADRIELCSDLSCGGLTPSANSMRAAREEVRLPIHILIRPRAGDFCYSEAELETMQRAIDLAKGIAMNGIVIGVLDAANN